MATFRIGQRVKRVRVPLGGDVKFAKIGQEGVVVGFEAGDLGTRVKWDIPPPESLQGESTVYTDSLAPLTDPNAEWATEQVRKLFKMLVAA